MDHKDFGWTEDPVHTGDETSLPDDLGCGKAAVVELRALKLFVLRSTAQKHGGTIAYDLETDTVVMDVPKENIPACKEEVARQLGAAFRFFQSQRPSFMDGLMQ